METTKKNLEQANKDLEAKEKALQAVSAYCFVLLANRNGRRALLPSDICVGWSRALQSLSQPSTAFFVVISLKVGTRIAQSV